MEKRSADEPSVDAQTNTSAQKAERSKSHDAVVIYGDDTDLIKPLENFSTASFDKKLLSFCKQYAAPSPIQAYAWPVLGLLRDFIGVAKTGSGKTVAFAVPSLDFILKNQIKQVQMLVLAPTRELCIQTYKVIAEIGSLVKLTCACIYGGVSKEDQRKEIRANPNVVVATPGRLNDFLDSNEIDISKISILVLDEADRMLDLGFEPEIRKIVAKIPKARQTLMFSATWPASIQKLAFEFLSKPVKITIGRNELSANSKIEQIVHVLADSNLKNGKLSDLLKKCHKNNNKIIVFVLYKIEAAKVEQYLKTCSYNCVSIHGDKNQYARNDAFDSFKSGKTPILVATDVAARGLDIPNVEYVINYTFPLTIEDYIHRIGRTGRGGKAGISHTFFTANDKAHSGELINTLKSTDQLVPEELFKFGTTVKRKEHKEYGAFFKEIDPSIKASHKKFANDDEE